MMLVGAVLVSSPASAATITVDTTKTSSEDDEVISFDCDLALGDYLKETTFAFHRHRRIEHYKLITERVGAEPPPE